MPSVPDSASSLVGEWAALGQVWEAHRERLLAMIERRLDPKLRQHVGPDEVLQLTLLDARRKWAKYQQGSKMKPYPWLYRLAMDRLIEEYRKHKRQGLDREMPLGDDGSAVLAGYVDPATGPLTAAQRADLADRINVVLASLPPDDAAVIEMRYFDQLSTREICDIVNDRKPDAVPVTENAMNVRLFRALEKLQKLWKAKFGTPESVL